MGRGGQVKVEHQPIGAHRLVEALDPQSAGIAHSYAVHSTNDVMHRLTHQHLARLGMRAQPRRQIQRLTTEVILNRDRLPHIKANADPKRQRRIRPQMLCEPPLHVRSRLNRSSR